MFPSFFTSTASQNFRALPVEVPYSAAALALQGNKYPPTSMSVPNEFAFPMSYLGAREFGFSPYGGSGQYGQRALLPGPI